MKYFFYLQFCILGLIAIGLCTFSLFLVEIEPTLSSVFITQIIHLFYAFAFLGIGIGIPVLFFATILSWIQFLLLLTKEINPHLGDAGLVKALSVLFNKL